MGHINIEIKAKSEDLTKIRSYLLQQRAFFAGIDHQKDTYFNVANGRLKLRQGNVENALIFYKRENEAGPKQSNIILQTLSPDNQIHPILSQTIGVLAEVNKKREIYFLDNVKFHLDEVEKLGQYVEIEAIDMDGTLGLETIRKQCEFYIQELGIKEEDFITMSYSDMVLGL